MNKPDFEMIEDALNDLAQAQENGSLPSANQYPIGAIREQIEALQAWQAARPYASKPRSEGESEAGLLRKQADAVEAAANEFRYHGIDGVRDYGQRLRQQAEAAEKSRGGK